MGAAIPLALSLALAIRDAVPGGEPPAPVSRGGEGEDDGEGIVRMSVRTGSKTVSDEVTPLDEVRPPLPLSLPLALSLARPGTDAARRVRRTRTSCTSRGPRAR